MPIDIITDYSNRNKFGTVEETIQMLKALEESKDYLKASNFMSVTVFDALSLHSLKENYL